MLFRSSGFLLFALISFAVAGCGGGSGGSSGGTGGGGGGSPETVTVNFTGDTLTAVATQIGSGAFTAATVASNKVTLTVPAGTTRFAVAYACQTITGSGSSQNTFTFQNVIEASTLDGTSFSQSCGASPISLTGALTGAVDASAIAGANYVAVTASSGGGSETYFLSGSSSNFNLLMPPGTDRVAVGGYAYTSTSQFGANSIWTLEAIRNFTGVAVPGAVNGGLPVTLGAGDAVTQQPITYQNVPSGFSVPSTFALFGWNGGGSMVLSNGLTTQYPVVPAAAVQSGDYYIFQSTTETSLPSGVTEEAWVNTFTSANGPLTVSFPAAWTYAGPVPAAQPMFDFSGAPISGKTGVTAMGELVWNVGSSTGIETSVQATGNYLNGSTSLAFPSLVGLTGFVSPASGTRVVWFASVSQSSAGALQQIVKSGSATGVANSGTFSVP
jgi:hypothetical protein